jgi:hypothetical protein
MNGTKNFIAPCLRICKTLFCPVHFGARDSKNFPFYYNKLVDGSKSKTNPVKELSEAVLLLRTEDKKPTGLIKNASFRNCNPVLKQP